MGTDDSRFWSSRVPDCSHPLQKEYSLFAPFPAVRLVSSGNSTLRCEFPRCSWAKPTSTWHIRADVHQISGVRRNRFWIMHTFESTAVFVTATRPPQIHPSIAIKTLSSSPLAASRHAPGNISDDDNVRYHLDHGNEEHTILTSDASRSRSSTEDDSELLHSPEGNEDHTNVSGLDGMAALRTDTSSISHAVLDARWPDQIPITRSSQSTDFPNIGIFVEGSSRPESVYSKISREN
ncbi:hypothetical protein BZA05DRAFT_422637 [Tricharina praecox]|uniref:uncharacterized protein n=1 Tax=Tricharina praecox TaxID=43433 RepID=UPI00221ED3CC|nr:uncharacterized protein BZA05DRAFT_422637 [Tricharina praecox]KAI5842079.1 hypothetical protein BZA05DRAFT_422637 [Tricharina praecox]